MNFTDASAEAVAAPDGAPLLCLRGRGAAARHAPGRIPYVSPPNTPGMFGISLINTPKLFFLKYIRAETLTIHFKVIK